MKFSTMMVVIAAALAMVSSGCKYDKAGKGAGDDFANAKDINGGAESGDLDSITDGGKFEDLYTRCTDVDFAPVYFGFDSTVVAQGELGKIEAVAQHLGEKTDRVVVVEGNCDERGSNEYNMSLGENRAVIIRNYLVEKGVTADRIQTRSYGSEKPAVDGHDESAWAKNRRGDFAIFQK